MSEHDEPSSSLREQAAGLRGHGGRPALTPTATMSPARAFLHLSVIVVLVGGSLALLLSETLRVGAISAVAGGISGYVDPGQEVFPMPPPRPGDPERIYVGGGPVTFSSGGADIIYDPEQAAAPQTEQADEFVPAVRSAETRQAYAHLVAKSDLAGRLSRNEVAGYRFKEWNPRVARDPVFLVDLVVVRESDGEELTLVFQVNLQDESIRAVNQAARDLERRAGQAPG